MAKLLKGFAILVVLLLLVAVIAMFVVASNLGSIIKSGVNEYGPDIVGVPVSVGSVDVSLLNGTASLGQLIVANPSGFSGGNVFQLDSVDLALDLESLRGDVIVIDRIAVDGAAVLAEQVGRKTNLQVLAEKMNTGDDGQAASSSASSADGEASEPPKIAIALFEFTNASAEVKSEQLGEQSVAINDITLKNIGTPEQGLTIESAAQAVLQPLMKKVIAEVQKQALDKAVDKEVDKALDKALGDKAGQYKGALKGLLNK